MPGQQTPITFHRERELLGSWNSNAAHWTRMVRDGLLRSRIEVTNAAILDAVGRAEGEALLDLGCGEGWLTHLLVERGWKAVGVDACPELIEAARSGPGEFLCAEYEQLESILA